MLRPLTVCEITEALLIVDDDYYDDLDINEMPDAVDEDYINNENGQELKPMIFLPWMDL